MERTGLILEPASSPTPAATYIGTTENGGANGKGAVFEVAAGTHALSTLATFNRANGANPRGGLIADVSGNLFGTTRLGGDLSVGGGLGNGAVFEVAAGTHALMTLATFHGTKGNSHSPA